MGAQPMRHEARVQAMRPEARPAGTMAGRRARHDPAPAGGWAGRAAAALALAALLGGCGTLDPAGWFHKREGGVIAQQKGPLPGENRPYPNLATVPPAPSPPDLKALRQITAGLVADRENAQLQAEATPLPDPSRPSTAPGLFGVGTLPPPVPPPAGGLSATLPAVSTPAPAAAPPRKAAPPRPPAKAPVAPVKSAELAPPPAMHAAAPAPAAPPPAAPAAASPVSTGPVSAGPGKPAVPAKPAAAPVATAAPPPAMPMAPPAPPRISGPAGGTTVGAAPAASAPAAVTAEMVRVGFAPGSATLPPAALDALKSLAGRRGTKGITVTGYGEASGSDPSAQVAAVSLGLARAQAIAAALTADGVPAAALRVLSAAAGPKGSKGGSQGGSQGGSAQLQ